MESILIFTAGMFFGWLLTPVKPKEIEKEKYQVSIEFIDKSYLAYHNNDFIMQNISLQVLVEELARKVGDFDIVVADDDIADQLTKLLKTTS